MKGNKCRNEKATGRESDSGAPSGGRFFYFKVKYHFFFFESNFVVFGLFVNSFVVDFTVGLNAGLKRGDDNAICFTFLTTTTK